MVPTFTCGLLRSNFSLAMSPILVVYECSGADVQDRTGDLVLTKDALCQLSYIGKSVFSRQSPVVSPSSSRQPADERRLATADWFGAAAGVVTADQQLGRLGRY